VPVAEVRDQPDDPDLHREILLRDQGGVGGNGDEFLDDAWDQDLP
jgi:hypothetical protein